MRRLPVQLARVLATLLTLAACSEPVQRAQTPSYQPSAKCSQAVMVDQTQAENAVQAANQQAGFTALEYDDFLDKSVLILGQDAAAQTVDAATVATALTDLFQCANLEVQVNQPNLLAVLPSLDLASASVTISLERQELKADPLLLTPLERVANLDTLRFRGSLLPGDFPKLDTVTTLQMGGEDLSEVSFDSIGARFTNLETLTVLIGRDTVWQPEDLATLVGLTSLNFTLYKVLSEPSLEGISQETLDLILQAPELMPGLTQLNGVAVDQVSQEALAPGEVLTQAERQAEEDAALATEQLEAWGKDILEADWETGRKVSQVPGPVLVYDARGRSSAAQAARGQDWNGISAAKLCKTVDQCKAVVVVGHRAGAKDGFYQANDDPDRKIDAYKGETTVTVYDAENQLVRPAAVVATAPPPPSITSEEEATGAPDWDQAWEYIESHTE